jgi:hypothetical protein
LTTPDPGSFRDPTGQVAISAGRILRLLSARGAADARTALAAPSVASATERGDVIASAWTTLPDASTTLADGAAVGEVLEHPRLPFIAYPYEWTFAMLQDAALLTLRLLRETAADGLSLKDATPYNVQFRGSRPVFIDVGSFEPAAASDPWFGRQQFLQMFLYPLMLQAYAGAAFQPWLRGSLEGITAPELDGVLGGPRLRHRRRGRLVHVKANAAAARRLRTRTEGVEAETRRSGLSRELLLTQWKALERLVGGLEWQEARSVWSDYGARGHYADAELAAKERFVAGVAATRHRELVYDLGANDGRFSRIALEHAAYVVAADADRLVVDRLYRELRAQGEERIQPLTIDLADPSPGLGWAGAERPSFADRARPELVLYLAVVHHLAIGRNVPVALQLDQLARLGGEVVFEFPTESDPKVQELLLAKRSGIFDGYRLEHVDRDVAERFDVRQREVLEGGTRVLYHLAPRV